VREAVSDLYYNSWRFLGANVIVGAALIVILLAAVGSLWALLLLPLAAVPAAGAMRMATRLVRDGSTGFDSFTELFRRPGRVLLLASAQGLVLLVLGVDVAVGGELGSFAGSLLQVSALYGLAIGWAYAAAAWPIVLDPERDGDPLRARLRLALVILVAHPVRVGGVLLAAGLLLVVSVLLIAPFVTFAITLVWLGIARFVLPVADRIEGRATRVVEFDAD